MTLGRKIRAFRRKCRITQEEFAELIGSTRATVCHWEKEKNEPKIKVVLERIEKVLKEGDPFVAKGERRKSFGGVLRRFRKKHRLTQRQLAEKLGVKEDTEGKWERGEKYPRREREKEILEALEGNAFLEKEKVK